jgi:hypothetical protein
MNQGPIWVLLMKKKGGGKSRATVPLRNHKFLSQHSCLLYKTLINPFLEITENPKKRNSLRFYRKYQNALFNTNV